MFAVVRTGGKQYRVAAGDKIAVEKLAGEAGDTIKLGDVLLAGEGDNLADAAKTVVSAEIIAQAKSEKVTVFKKRRRHNYRRKAGHRQQMTLLRIVQVGDSKAEKSAPKKEAAPTAETKATADAPAKDTSEDKAAPVAKKAAPKKDGAASKSGAHPAEGKGAAVATKETAKEAKKVAGDKKPAATKAPAKKAAPKDEAKK